MINQRNQIKKQDEKIKGNWDKINFTFYST